MMGFLMLIYSYSMIVRLGPNSPAMDGLSPSGGNGLQDNSRCLRRDISNFASSHWLKDSDIVNVILNSSDIATFHRTINGRFNEGFLGIHSAGHFTIGADADVSSTDYLSYVPS
jgi:tyrosinase